MSNFENGTSWNKLIPSCDAIGGCTNGVFGTTSGEMIARYHALNPTPFQSETNKALPNLIARATGPNFPA